MSAIFSYTALGRDGRRTVGTLSAESRAAALSEMSRLGLVPVTIDQAKNAAAAKKAVAATTGSIKISQRTVENFTRELANLLAGGVSLARSLALLRREASNPPAKQLWSEIHRRRRRRHIARRRAGEMAANLFDGLRRHGPRWRGGRISRCGAQPDCRVPHARVGSQGQK